jgi:DNA ligase 4
LIHCISGQADIGTREIIDFSSYNALQLLNKAFARAIARRWKGIVLKGCDDPYFSFHGTKLFIKLKKDHIAGLKNTANFTIIGGRRDARDEQELKIGKLW